MRRGLGLTGACCFTYINRIERVPIHYRTQTEHTTRKRHPRARIFAQAALLSPVLRSQLGRESALRSVWFCCRSNGVCLRLPESIRVSWGLFESVGVYFSLFESILVYLSLFESSWV